MFPKQELKAKIECCPRKMGDPMYMDSSGKIATRAELAHEEGIDWRVWDAVSDNARASSSWVHPMHRANVSFKIGLSAAEASKGLYDILSKASLFKDCDPIYFHPLSKWECFKYAPFPTMRWFVFWMYAKILGCEFRRRKTEEENASDELFDRVKVGKTSFGEMADGLQKNDR